MPPRRKPRPAPPPQRRSVCLLVRLATADVAMFRFLLESYENVAGFSVLERRPALLKLFFSPDQETVVKAALAAIGETVPLEVTAWPLPPWPALPEAGGGPLAAMAGPCKKALS